MIEHDKELMLTMANAHALLTKAADVLASAVPTPQDWPADLDESAPKWADLMDHLGQIAGWVVQAAVVVRDDAETLPNNRGHALAGHANQLVAALYAAMTSRAVVNHRWRGVATSFTQARTNMASNAQLRTHERTPVAGVLHDAAQAVGNAANQRVTPGDVVAVLDNASTVCTQMCGLVTRIADALARRQNDYPDLAGISRALRGHIHRTYQNTGTQFATAARVCEALLSRWPGRWPDSI